MADTYTGTSAGSPDATPHPYDGATPGSGEFGLYESTANAALKNAITRISNQRGQLLQQSGFSGRFNHDTGAYEGFDVQGDNSAAFGTYQSMMRGYADTGEESDASQRGLGFKGGLAQQMGDRTKMGVQQGTLDYFKDYNKGIADLGDQEAAAHVSHDQQLYDEKLQEVQLGISNGDFNQAVIPPSTGDDYKGDPDWKPAGTTTTTTKPPKGPGPHRQPGETRAQFAARLYNYRHRKGGRH